MPRSFRTGTTTSRSYLRDADAQSQTSVERLREDGPFADVLVNQYADGWAEQSSRAKERAVRRVYDGSSDRGRPV